MNRFSRTLTLTQKIKFRFNYLNDLSDISEDQQQLQQSALQFAKEKLLPYAGEWDRTHHFPKDVLREAAQQGYAGLYISPEYGGCGLDRLSTSIVFEALSYGCISSTAYLTINNMCAKMIELNGNEEQKQNWVTKLTTLEQFASYCLTEPNSGSDSKAMKTTAKMDGDDYVINGSKCFITGGSVSDLYLVMCKTDQNEVSTIVVENGTKGLNFGKLEDKMGWRSSPTAMVMFEDCRVPKKNLIGKQGEGFKFAMQALDGGRVNIASCSLGGAALAFDTAREYMTVRKQFGKNLSDFQYLQFKLSDMATQLISSRLMVRNAARLIDQNDQNKSLYSAMAKRYATDTCSNIANEALQIHGGYGYLSDYPLERIVRDLRVHQILEGTNEIMRLIISRNLFK